MQICRRFLQSLFYEIAETFIQCINTLTADEIEQLDADWDLTAEGLNQQLKSKTILNYWGCFSYFIIS